MVPRREPPAAHCAAAGRPAADMEPSLPPITRASTTGSQARSVTFELSKVEELLVCCEDNRGPSFVERQSEFDSERLPCPNPDNKDDHAWYHSRYWSGAAAIAVLLVAAGSSACIAYSVGRRHGAAGCESSIVK